MYNRNLSSQCGLFFHNFFHFFLPTQPLLIVRNWFLKLWAKSVSRTLNFGLDLTIWRFGHWITCNLNTQGNTLHITLYVTLVYLERCNAEMCNQVVGFKSCGLYLQKRYRYLYVYVSVLKTEVNMYIVQVG